MPLSYDQVQAEIETTCVRLEELVEEILVAAREAAAAEANYKIALAKSRLKYRDDCRRTHTKTNMDDVTDHAMVETEDLFQPHLLAANNLMTLREALRACQARLDGLRSLSAAFRSAGG